MPHLLSQRFTDLFIALEKKNIDWCSWKSNEHLDSALIGETDLDALFFLDSRQSVTKIMHQCGFVLFQATPHRAYPGVVDFISIDAVSGNVLHVHAHFMLTLGEKYIKSYIFPWNQVILQNKILYKPSSNIFASSHEMELAFLLIRYAVKSRWRDIFKQYFTKKFGDSDFWTEFHWLLERTSSEKLKPALREMLDDKTLRHVIEIVDSNPSSQNMLSLKKHIEFTADKLGWRRIFSPFISFLMWKNEIKEKLVRVFEKIKLSQNFIIRRRTLKGEGLIVAFLGADGAGKSTVTKNIIKNWEHKIDFSYLYCGSGDGQKGMLTVILKIFLKFGVKAKSFIKTKDIKTNQTEPVHLTQSTASNSTILVAIVGCIEKKRLIKKALRLKSKGLIVICDRWPQNQQQGCNDGPLLQFLSNHKNVLYRTIGAWEEKQFKKMSYIQQPDVVIKLITSLETAIRRKPENCDIQALIDRKIDGIKALEFSNSITESINAEKSLSYVLNNVQNIIWDALSKREQVKPVYYECVGSSGAGKTTFCRSQSNNNLVSVEQLFCTCLTEKLSKAGLLIQSFFLCFSVYCCVFILFLRYPSLMNRASMLYLLKLPVQKIKLQRIIDRNTLYIAEQLFLQNIWSSLLLGKVEHMKAKHLSPLIRAVYQGVFTRIIYFKVSEQNAAARILGRPKQDSQFDKLTPDELKNRLQESTPLMVDIIKAATQAGLDVACIDADQNISAVIQDAEEVL